MSKRANNEGSIFLRKDGRWAATLSLPDGRRRTFYARTRLGVTEKLRAASRAREDGLPIPSERLTTERFLVLWLDTVRQSVRPRTYEAYELNVRRLNPLIGRVKLGALSPAHVQSSYNALLNRGLSRRSIEQAHAVLHRALRQAVLWGHVARNATDAVNVPRPTRREMQTLTQEQVQQLFDATAADRLHALWVLLVTTGLRIGEALAVKWSDLDLRTGQMAIQRALQRQRGVGLVFVEPKTAKSRRVVHLPAQTAAVLAEHRKRQIEERLLAGPMWQERDLIFCREDGRPVEPSAVHSRLQIALKKAGLPRRRVHDLRHSAATLLLSRGVHPKVVQDLLGHSTIALTMDTYSHVSPALHKEAASQMDALFKTG